MADKKISELSAQSNSTAGDYFIINNEDNTTNKINYANLMKAGHRGNSTTTFVGNLAGEGNTGTNNTGVGQNVLRNTTGAGNTAIGRLALERNTDGDSNTAAGASALKYHITGDNNTGVGVNALFGVDGGSNTGTNNTAVGVSSLKVNDTGVDNTAVGVSSLFLNTSGNNNTAVGRSAAYNNISGDRNVSCGINAGYYNQIGSSNINVGCVSAMYNQGGHNVFVGHQSGYYAYGAYNDTHVGRNSGMRSGSQHDITDTPSMVENRLTMIIDVGTGSTPWADYGWGDSVWASGTYYHAGQIRQHNGTTYRSLSYHYTNTDNEPGVGVNEAYYWEVATTAQNYDLFYTNTTTGTGDGKVALFTTYNTSLGGNAFSDPSVSLYYNSTALGYDAEPTGSNQVVLGNSSTDTYLGSGVQVTSDERDKADIEDTPLGLDFISALTPRQFRWDSRSDYYETTYTEEEQVTTETDPETGEETTTTETVHIPNKVSKPRDGSKKRTRLHQGLIAQEVKQVMDDMGIDFAGYQDHTVNGGADQLTLGYSELIAPMIKAIQELKARIEVLEGA